MTNKDEFGDTSCDTGVVDLLAVHLINQVLNEASIIVNAAKDSGQPWIYISSLKKLRHCRLDETYDEGLSFIVSNGDNKFKYKNQENIVVTSTPQKIENKIVKPRNEASFMGQGDEELEVRDYELRKSTSMFINHLFDMSDVERVVFTDEPDRMQNRNSRSEELLKYCKINNFKSKQLPNKLEDSSNSNSAKNSSYSFLNDALCIEIPKYLDFSKRNDDVNNENKLLGSIECVSKNKELTYVLNETIETMDNNDLALYENAYLTMNRDYEQFSEEEEPVLKDPKAASLQEVDLITINTSIDNVTSCKVSVTKELNATSGVSSYGTGSRKSNIIRRCRNQGARLLSCLKRWWWRRKLLGKRKETRVFGSIRGLCPLSPDARRRAASLLDQRNLRMPSPSRSVFWKFNTVNEAHVNNSSRWKDFDLKANLN